MTQDLNKNIDQLCKIIQRFDDILISLQRNLKDNLEFNCNYINFLSQRIELDIFIYSLKQPISNKPMDDQVNLIGQMFNATNYLNFDIKIDEIENYCRLQNQEIKNEMNKLQQEKQQIQEAKRIEQENLLKQLEEQKQLEQQLQLKQQELIEQQELIKQQELDKEDSNKKDNLSETEDIEVKCLECLSEIKECKIQLSCLHSYHVQCFVQRIQQKYSKRIACICGIQITNQFILQFLKTQDQPTYNSYIQIVYEKLLESVKDRFQKGQCLHCGFIYLSQENEQVEHCVNCQDELNDNNQISQENQY